MSSSMHTPTKDIISMIERYDHHPHNLPAAKRIGYAIGLVGIALQKGYTEHELKRIICDYVAAQRQELALVESDVHDARIGHRELLCREMLCAITELEKNAKSHEQAKADNIAAWSKDVVVATGFAVHNDDQPVIDEDLVVDGDNVDTPEFVHITASDAESSEEGASDWELV